MSYQPTSTARGVPMNAAIAKVASASALAAYPAGVLTLRFAPDELGPSLLGYGLILVAAIGAMMLSASSVQRIAADHITKLDEYELALRHRAMSFSYACFSALALLAVLYAGIASDAGGWVPRTYDEFNGLFWGVFLYATVLPSAFLAWTATDEPRG